MKLKDKMVVEFNEVQGKEGTEYIEQIKDFVMREHNDIRELYKDYYPQKHIARIFIITNSLNPIPQDEEERRWVWIKLSGSKVGDREFWNKLYLHFDDDVWIEKIANQLLRVKGVEKYFNDKIYPETAIMKEYYKLNRPTQIDFLWHGIVKRECIEFDDDEVDGKLYIQASKLYERYEEYCIENHINKKEWNGKHFRKMICNERGVYDVKQICINGVNKRRFTFNMKQLEKGLEKRFIENDDEKIEEITYTKGCLTLDDD